MAIGARTVPIEYKSALRWHFVWLCLLVASFCYEIPLYIATPYDRANPRLFDIVLLIGLLTVSPRFWWHEANSSVVSLWTRVVLVFCFCACVWTVLWLPWEQGQFSLFFAAKYLEGLLAVRLVDGIPLSPKQKRNLLHLFLAGAIFVTVYSIPQYLSTSTTTAIDLTPEKSISIVRGTILGPLGRTYFHIAQFSILAMSLSFACACTEKRIAKTWIYLFVGSLVAWPATVCGARVGLLGVMFVILFYLLISSLFRRAAVAAIPLVLLGVYVFQADHSKHFSLADSSLSFERLVDLENDTQNYDKSLDGRLKNALLNFRLSDYQFGGLLLPLFGGGFYVAPVVEGGSLRYRVDYGVHNIYVFAFEQGGTAALILFLFFMIKCFRKLSSLRRTAEPETATFALGMLCFLTITAIAGMAGQIFWMGFGTVHFNVCVLVMVVIACKMPRRRGATSLPIPLAIRTAYLPASLNSP